MRGAGDTVRSIIISANSRLAFLENKQVLRLLSKDELNLADIGIGVNGDGETKTALFCVIPDSDKSYNFIIGMLYTQIFQELYYQADFNCGGRLPIHVTFMLDEFANVALPDDYCSLLSTMRSREISSIIIIQNFAQLKALFKDTWETIPMNCDTFIYLGGNEQSTHKYVSELLGKGTIDKKSSGETKGRQGSSSRNNQVLIGPPFEILPKRAVEHYEKQKEKGENVYIDDLKYEEFMMLGEMELNHRFSSLEEKEQKDKLNQEQAQELEYSEETASEQKQETKTAFNREKSEWEDTLTNRMLHWNYMEGQKAELYKAMEKKVSKAVIMQYFYPDIGVETMHEKFTMNN